MKSLHFQKVEASKEIGGSRSWAFKANLAVAEGGISPSEVTARIDDLAFCESAVDEKLPVNVDNGSCFGVIFDGLHTRDSIIAIPFNALAPSPDFGYDRKGVFM
ncbi:MAG TPA: hypothetical protein VGA39_04005 [Candidatus Acidoferrales bacterium]